MGDIVEVEIDRNIGSLSYKINDDGFAGIAFEDSALTIGDLFPAFALGQEGDTLAFIN